MADNLEGDSIWLTGELKMPSMFCDRKEDVEAENRVLRAQLVAATHERDELRLSLKQHRTSTFSQQPADGSSNDLSQEPPRQSTRLMQNRDEEIKQLKMILENERTTTNMWQLKATDAASAKAKAEAKLAETEQSAAVAAQATISKLKNEFATEKAQLTAEAERNLKSAVDSATKTLESRLRELQGCADSGKEATQELEKMKQKLAQMTVDAEAALRCKENAAREFETRVGEMEDEHRTIVASLKDEHARALLRLESNHNEAMLRQQAAASEELANARQRQSQGQSAAREETRRLRQQVDDLEAKLGEKSAAYDAAVAQATQVKKRMDEEKSGATAALQEEHRLAIRKLMDEHYAEISNLKAKLAEQETLMATVKRHEGQIETLKSAVEAKDAEIHRVTQVSAERGRTSAKKEDTIRDLELKIAKLEDALSTAEASSAEALKQMQLEHHSKVDELLSQIQEANHKFEGERANFGTQLAEMRQRAAQAEADFSDFETESRKKELSLMSAESSARKQLAEVTTRLDEALRTMSAGDSNTEHLQAQINDLRREKEELQEQFVRLSNIHEDMKGRFVQEQVQVKHLTSKLDVLRNTKDHLERQLEVARTPVGKDYAEFNRRQHNSTSPAPAAPVVTVRLDQSQTSTQENQRRPLSPTPTNTTSPMSQKTKRHRSEERVFAFTGFDAKSSSCFANVESLKGATVIESKSNAPVPSMLTHLVTAGQLTVKLLTALVRGCWVVSESYVKDSVTAGRWLDETPYGFRHPAALLKGLRVCYTDEFQATRHYSTAKTVVSEGSALIVDSEDALSCGDDILMCTPQEYKTLRKTVTAFRVFTWDLMVKFIYPVPIGQ